MSIFDGFPRGTPDIALTDARLATASWRAALPEWRSGMLWLGRDDQDRAVGYADDRHIVTVAGSRSGKGRSAIIPNLLLWPGSCVVTDPKGENASRTAAVRAKLHGHRVVVVDPARVADVPNGFRVAFNPLDLIDAGADDALDLASAIGDALMIGSGDGKDIHWTESARQIVEALILHVAATETGEARSLVRVRQLLVTGDPDYADMLNAEEAAAKGDKARTLSPFDALWRSMSSSLARNRAVRDVIAGAAYTILDMGENERGSVLSTARRNTKFIDSVFMRQCLTGGGDAVLDIDDLKAASGGLSVYLCLPARFLPTHARFLRLILALMLYRMEAQGLTQPACGHPVLFVLDEFATLGRMESIEKAAGLMAGYGVKLWTILQDLGQLKRHFRESWETFLGNAGTLQFFGNADMTTLEWLSKRLGQVEVLRQTAGRSESTSTQLGRSQGSTKTSGWTVSEGRSEGMSHMADLSQIAARDGGSSMLPFLARSNASGTGRNEGSSLQQGQSGGESLQTGDSSSSGTSASETVADTLHLAPLLHPDEIARLLDRSTGRQIVLLDGCAAVIRRTNYDDDPGLATRA